MDYKNIIIEELTVLKQKEQQDGNTFKAIAYGKVINQITSLSKVEKIEDLSYLTGIGKSIKEKLEEIFATGILKQAEEVKKDIKVPVITSLMQIYGVGRVKANKLVKENQVTSLDDLREKLKTNPSLLNDKQTIGLMYYEDFLERIPRAEMLKHETILLNTLKEFKLEGEIVGSFRRGEKSSGDIDMLVKSDDHSILNTIILKLKEQNYVTHILAQGDKKFMGVSRINDKAKSRRLDILITTSEEYPFALLYFTGSDKFNVRMRKHALSKGVSLNEHGFTPKSPLMKNEEDIFKFIDFPYISPMDRKNS
jgi:DNA polymerase lambda